MRYIRSSGSFKQYTSDTKKGWRFFGFLKKRKKPSFSGSILPPLHSNPYKKNKFLNKRGPLQSLKKIIVPVLFIMWLLLMLYLPYFQVSEFTYLGLRNIKKEDIEDDIKKSFLHKHWILPGNNYFLVNTKKIETYILQKYSLESVSVEKRFPHGLTVDVEEKTTSIIYDDGTRYYLADQNGKIIQEISIGTVVTKTEPTSTELATFLTSATSTSSTPMAADHKPNYSELQENYSGYPVVYVQTTSTPTEQGNLPASLVDHILNLYNQIVKAKIAHVKYFQVKPDEETAIMYSDKPWQVYFRTKGDISVQINNLKVILKDNKPFEYIDVRFGDHVYWK